MPGRKRETMRHTKGPWVTDTSHKADYEGITVWADGEIVAHVVPDQHNNHEANARLIAQAPTLLEVLKDIVNQTVDPVEELNGSIRCGFCGQDLTMDESLCNSEDCTGTRAKRAIVKAEGGDHE